MRTTGPGVSCTLTSEKKTPERLIRLGVGLKPAKLVKGGSESGLESGLETELASGLESV
jgi:hypothetical protein